MNMWLNMKKSNFDPIKFFSLAGTLKKIPRTGWLTHGLINVESIAEHSYRVGIMGLILSEEMGCDSSKMIKMALIHDIAEILTGDIVWEHGFLTDFLLKKTKSERERLAIISLSSLVKSGNELKLLWEEYESQKSKEAKLLKQIDKLEMVIQALEYENPRNPNHLKEFWENAKKHITEPILLNIFKELCKRRTPPYNDYDLIEKNVL